MDQPVVSSATGPSWSLQDKIRAHTRRTSQQPPRDPLIRFELHGAFIPPRAHNQTGEPRKRGNFSLDKHRSRRCPWVTSGERENRVGCPPKPVMLGAWLSRHRSLALGACHRGPASLPEHAILPLNPLLAPAGSPRICPRRKGPRSWMRSQ
jgi:hypothetical protein